MRQYLSPRQFLRMAAASFVVLIFLLAIIQSRRGNDAGIMAPLGHGKTDALVPELARCRAELESARERLRSSELEITAVRSSTTWRLGRAVVAPLSRLVAGWRGKRR